MTISCSSPLADEIFVTLLNALKPEHHVYTLQDLSYLQIQQSFQSCKAPLHRLPKDLQQYLDSPNAVTLIGDNCKVEWIQVKVNGENTEQRRRITLLTLVEIRQT